MDPFFAGPSDFMATGFAPPPEPAFAMNSNNRFRPVSRRLGAGIRDVDGRRARARSHSSDQKFSGTSIDVDAAGMRSETVRLSDMFSRVSQQNHASGKRTRFRLWLC